MTSYEHIVDVMSDPDITAADVWYGIESAVPCGTEIRRRIAVYALRRRLADEQSVHKYATASGQRHLQCYTMEKISRLRGRLAKLGENDWCRQAADAVVEDQSAREHYE